MNGLFSSGNPLSSVSLRPFPCRHPLDLPSPYLSKPKCLTGTAPFHPIRPNRSCVLLLSYFYSHPCHLLLRPHTITCPRTDSAVWQNVGRCVTRAFLRSACSTTRPLSPHRKHRVAKNWWQTVWGIIKATRNPSLFVALFSHWLLSHIASLPHLANSSFDKTVSQLP